MSALSAVLEKLRSERAAALLCKAELTPAWLLRGAVTDMRARARASSLTPAKAMKMIMAPSGCLPRTVRTMGVGVRSLRLWLRLMRTKLMKARLSPRVVILRLRTSGRVFKDPNLREEFVGFLFFLMQCGADERLGNFATDGTVYPFFLRPFFVWLGLFLPQGSNQVCLRRLCISF